MCIINSDSASISKTIIPTDCEPFAKIWQSLNSTLLYENQLLNNNLSLESKQDALTNQVQRVSAGGLSAQLCAAGKIYAEVCVSFDFEVGQQLIWNCNL